MPIHTLSIITVTSDKGIAIFRTKPPSLSWLMLGVVVFVASVELVMTSVEFVTTVDLLRSVPEGPDVEGAVG